MTFSNKYSDALASLNQKTMCFFESDLIQDALSNITSKINTSIPTDIILPSFQESLESITRSYTELFRTYDFGYMISDSLNATLANIQVNTLYQISQSAQTVMIHDLAKCFANAQYSKLVNILNQSISAKIIAASDVAFIKAAELVDILSSELKYPRGFSKSLKELSKATANDIADNEDLEYNTIKNRFLSADGEVDSIGLNVICSGKKIFCVATGEIFTESELIDFCSFLSQTPMLALKSNTGNKIFELINELLCSGEKTIGFDKDIYYHCRSHKTDIQPFTFDQMLKAPNGLPWAGRFNQVGRSNYYFADTRIGAETEVKKHKLIDDVLQTVMLKPMKDVKILDLSGTLARGTTFLRYLRYRLDDVNDKMPRQYLIPCFVADCCKNIGFDGIKYYGSKNYSNYVTWNDGYFDYAGMCE